MFKSNTLFIVGAGASVEAGLPVGEDLKQHVADLLDLRFDDGWHQNAGDKLIRKALLEKVGKPNGHPGEIEAYLRKAWRIRDVVPAAAISIDNYLDAHQGDEHTELCGKLGIVRAILNAEAESKLRAVDRFDDGFLLRDLYGTWYSRFFQMLTENVPKAAVDSVFDNVSFITFNYDRCIERFLAQALSDYYEIELSKMEALVAEKLRIYHPYGQVGALPWQDRRKPVAFGANAPDLLELAAGIRTFAEGRLDEELMADVHNAVLEAETLVFLGFAFHPLNMKLLTPEGMAFPNRIFATTLGMSDADEDVIKNAIWRMLGKTELKIGEGPDPEFAKLTCAEFFREYFRSMSASPDEELPVTVPVSGYSMPDLPNMHSFNWPK